jgi:hypothetical protein
VATILRHSNTCQIKMAKSAKLTEAVVQDFEQHKILNVIVGKAVKISMIWNGRCYEGRNAGMDFESAGPTVSRTTTGR